ncbi:MAG TPA: hypothetical protein VKZ18_10965 [Polyangia bacterium]|nr:hypothetical protein [Polyangia bacterium]
MKMQRPRRVKFALSTVAAGLSALAFGPAAQAQIAAATAAAEAPSAAPVQALPVAAAAGEPPPGIEPQPAYPYGPPPEYAPPPPPQYAPPPPQYDYGAPYYRYDAPYAPYYRPYRHRYRGMPYAYPANAPAESMAGFHTHDGFFMRVQLGIAATGFSSTTAGTKTNYSGGGSSAGIAIGGTIARDLILYATVFGTSTANPDYQLAGASMPTVVGSIDVAALGPGLAYYFEQTNIYVSAAFGLAGFEMHGANAPRSKIDWSRSGTALQLMVGKEWWVSRDWGLGIAAELFAASLKDDLTPGLTWSAGAGSILFSATYN